jgi:GDP-L-fucose synthase
MSSSSSSVSSSKSVVLVTGGSGLVGHALQKVVEHDKYMTSNTEEWIFLSSKDGDLRDADECERIFERYKPSYVIHLAAFVGGLFRNMSHPVDFWHNNISMDENIIKSSHKHNVKKVVSCLSTCIFPDKTKYPIDETMIHDGMFTSLDSTLRSYVTYWQARYLLRFSISIAATIKDMKEIRKV